MSLAVIIMAAGKGTRMQSELPKVLHKANGRPVIEYVLDTALHLKPETIILIVGHQADKVIAATRQYPVICALQEPQNGTGHAVMQAEKALKTFSGDVLILSGDVPLVKRSTLLQLIALHHNEQASATVLTARLDNPSGYGRIIRNKTGGEVMKIIEQRDASPEELSVDEINSGIYVFKAPVLFQALREITTENAQQEYYLTDVFDICFRNGNKVCACRTENADEIRGINTPEQLRETEQLLCALSLS
ncbi:sugar phosphate nucleotidyltransferase [Chlorobium phaeobacteroides]|jgi:UDP-N-acetylglucosamine pyrophosphorylase|uniref:UDP-N-acetylglucosamine pyrophosphorylase n=1 Tax=Chlorobium phaeobacteroides (strain DSM 266 / SMG 266 / 2430) TaxID=290317 RepID=A1BDG0_CHLPD|nr:sugar phosphate nucleotidyltransferase [Chlorobium phaeobacteroides]ABL64437.1 UDP-N-acetylglucosamine pyrophosphorylase [Chlorobium phaeobacteroides DSM 266]MBV5319796.1 NTP transferase domain-containing protein [Chlorobium phaeobacteroides]